MDHEARWNGRYREAGEGYLFGTAPNRFMAGRAGLFRAGESALLVADGEGRNSVWLAEQGLVVSAVDISPVAIKKAGRLATARQVNVAFALGDLLAPDWQPVAGEKHYDWLVGIFIQFAAPAERDLLLARMQEMTRPGGRIMLLGYTPRQLEYRTGGPAALENLYTADLLRQYFSAWHIEELVEYEDDITEGTGHKGRSALVGLVARKPVSA
ncbi:MAG: methyltransferase domain-containing protein [bacterium]|nr:methyltransferase domain-containing protein [bacterium]